MASDPGAQRRIGGRLGVGAACEHGLEFRDGLVKPVIDDDVIELVPVRHVAERIAQPARDHRLAVGAPVAQAPFELGQRRRQDEDGDAVRHRLPHLARALPVDLEQHVMSVGEYALDLAAAGAVQIVEHGRPLEQFARRRAAARTRRGLTKE